MSEKKSDNSHRPNEANKSSQQEYLPPLDFSSIVLPIFTQALLKLGLLGDPEKAESEVNLEIAHRLIDVLDLLKNRTKGNLNPEEEKFLDVCLQQLKAGYLEKARIITL